MILWICVLSVLLVSIRGDPKKVLLIGLDGLRADCLQQLHLPHIATIIDRGGYVDYENHRAEYPYVSTVNWASMLLGINQSMHGIIDPTFGLGKNNLEDFPSLVGLLQMNLATIQASNGPSLKTALLHTWWGIRNLIPDADVSRTAPSDDLLAARAEHLLRFDLDLDLIVVIFDDIDFVGHHLGGFDCRNDNYARRAEETDAMIGRFIAVLDNRTAENAHRGDPTPEDWLILLSSDHGGQFAGHDGASIFERDRFVVASHPLPPNLQAHFDGDNVKHGRKFNPTFVTHFVLSHFGIEEHDLPDSLRESYFWDGPEDQAYSWWLTRPVMLFDVIDILVTLGVWIGVSILMYIICFVTCCWTCCGKLDSVPDLPPVERALPSQVVDSRPVVVAAQLPSPEEDLQEPEERLVEGDAEQPDIFRELDEIYPYDLISKDETGEEVPAGIQTLGDFYREFPDYRPEGYTEEERLVERAPPSATRGPYLVSDPRFQTVADIERYRIEYERMLARQGRVRRGEEGEVAWSADDE